MKKIFLHVQVSHHLRIKHRGALTQFNAEEATGKEERKSQTKVKRRKPREKNNPEVVEYLDSEKKKKGREVNEQEEKEEWEGRREEEVGWKRIWGEKMKTQEKFEEQEKIRKDEEGGGE